MRWRKRAKGNAKFDAAHTEGEEPNESALKRLVHNTPIHITIYIRCCMKPGLSFEVCYEESGVVSFDFNMAALKSVCDLVVLLFLLTSNKSRLGLLRMVPTTRRLLMKGTEVVALSFFTDGEGDLKEPRFFRYFIMRVYCLSD